MRKRIWMSSAGAAGLLVAGAAVPALAAAETVPEPDSSASAEHPNPRGGMSGMSDMSEQMMQQMTEMHEQMMNDHSGNETAPAPAGEEQGENR